MTASCYEGKVSHSRKVIDGVRIDDCSAHWASPSLVKPRSDARSVKCVLTLEGPGQRVLLDLVPADGAGIQFLTVLEHRMVLWAHHASQLVSRKLVEQALLGVLLHAYHEHVTPALLASERWEGKCSHY